MKSIWYFVGLLLTIMGAIITAAGVYLVGHPDAGIRTPVCNSEPAQYSALNGPRGFLN
jgi:hypothetical protein